MIEVWSTIQSRPHGHSGRGISYYAAWAGPCGKKIQLDESLRDQGTDRENPVDARGFHYFDVGTYYHLLHEIAARGQHDHETWDCTDGSLDVDFEEALRLFRGWKLAFGSLEEKYGARLLGAEVDLPGDYVKSAKIMLEFGGLLTGRADAVIEIHDPQAAMLNTQTEKSSGLILQPGVYIVDFKTSGSYSDLDYFKYTRDLQARNYLALYNRVHPEKPAVGFIFDQINKHANLRRTPTYDKNGKMKASSSFHAYVQLPAPDDAQALQQLVRVARINRDNPKANPAACIGQYKVCPHLTSGLCPGY